MSSKEKQIKNSFIYFIPLGVTFLVPLVTLPLFTRLLTREDYGILAMAEIYSFIVNGLAWAGLEAAFERNFFKYQGDRQKMSQLMYSILAFSFGSLVVLASLTYMIQDHLAKLMLHNPRHGHIIFLSFLAVFMIRINEFYLMYFKNDEDAKGYATYQITYVLLNMVFSIYFVAVMKLGVTGMLLGQFCGAFIVGAILFLKMLARLKPSFSAPILKESLAIGAPLIPITFVKTVGSRIDNIMINYLVSLGVLGIYNIGQKTSNIIFTFMNNLEYVFRPQMYRRMFDLKEKGAVSIGRYLTPFFYLSIGCSLMVALFCEEFIRLMTPPSFHGAIDVSIVLCMYCGLLFFGKVTSPQLIYAQKPHILSMLLIPTYLLNIAFNIPFIMRWGALGAAWATLLSRIIAGSAAFLVAQKYYRIDWEYKKVGLILLMFLGSSSLLILLRMNQISYSLTMLFKWIAVSMYVALGYYLNIITPANYVLIKNLIRGHEPLSTPVKVLLEDQHV